MLAAAQEASSAFRVCMGYVETVQEMERKFENHRQSRNGLLADHRLTVTSLLETKGTVNALKNAQARESIAWLNSQLQATQVAGRLESAVAQERSNSKSFVPERNIDVRHTPHTQYQYFSDQFGFSQQSKELAAQLVNLRTRTDATVQNLKTIDVAGNLALQRFTALMQEFARQLREMQALQKQSIQLFDQYWELADILGQRSSIEHRAILRILRKSPSTNVGAQYLNALTLVRLGRYDKALPLINQLLQIPSIRPLIYVLRAELHARQGNKKQLLRDMQFALEMGKSEPRVRLHRAQVLWMAGEQAAAEREWEIVLKMGGNELAAHRAIAIINGLADSPNPKQKKKSLEYANLAIQLDTNNWANEAAIAVAEAANGNQDRATTAAERACALAVGSKRVFCEELLNNLEAGQTLSWKF